ncbi:MAG TPA: hypothetical protein VHC48_25080 [Puia sp.]|nr:hypothetical protein [Puia sp.]
MSAFDTMGVHLWSLCYSAFPPYLLTLKQQELLVTLEEMAGLSNRSLASFKRDFHRHYRCPPRQWINRQNSVSRRMSCEPKKRFIELFALPAGLPATLVL